MVIDSGHFDIRSLHADASSEGIHDGVGLLENFLEHEVVEAALFDGFNLHFELVHLRGDNRVLKVANGQAVLTVHDRDLFVVQVDDVLRVLDDGCRVRSDVKLILLADPDDEWARFARSNEQIGLVCVNDRNGVGAFHLLQCHLDGIGDGRVRSVLDFVNEVDEHLGVSVTDKGVAVGFEAGAKGFVILDDAVVNHSEPSKPRSMRVGVDVIGRPVRGPSGVSDAHGAGRNFVANKGQKVLDLSFFLFYLDGICPIKNGNTSAVVSAVFESLQPFDENGEAVFITYVSNNTAHRNTNLITIPIRSTSPRGGRWASSLWCRPRAAQPQVRSG